MDAQFIETLEDRRRVASYCTKPLTTDESIESFVLSGEFFS